MKKINKKTFWIMAAAVILFSAFFSLKIAKHYPENIDLSHESGTFGVTFSTKFCKELGLDWKETYQAMLGDLGVKYVRIPFYWDEIEKDKGKYDFSDYDYMVDEAQKEGAKLIISVGRREPRWPECHVPEWTASQSEAEDQADIISFITQVVDRYKDRPNVIYWQVENEAFLSTFGICPSLDKNFLEKEFATVKSLDGSRQVIITGSGELSSWQNEAKIGDIFGTTMYRVVYNNWIGYVRYPIPAWFYDFKARIAGISAERFMVIELQAEPWVAQGKMAYLNEREIDQTMDVTQFKANIQYALDIHPKQIYLWGVEWWYWQKLYGNPEYWSIAKTLFD